MMWYHSVDDIFYREFDDYLSGLMFVAKTSLCFIYSIYECFIVISEDLGHALDTNKLDTVYLSVTHDVDGQITYNFLRSTKLYVIKDIYCCIPTHLTTYLGH